jgi:lipid A 3-O-deacylase
MAEPSSSLLGATKMVLRLLLPLACVNLVSADEGMSLTVGDVKPKGNWQGESSSAYRLAYVHHLELDYGAFNRLDPKQYGIDVDLEFAYHHWDDFLYGDKHGLSITPMLSYRHSFGAVTLYIEGGIGLTYIDDDILGDRMLGSRLMFEDKIGIGLVFYERHRLGFAYIHYSNADLGDENDGLDAIGISYGYFW